MSSQYGREGGGAVCEVAQTWGRVGAAGGASPPLPRATDACARGKPSPLVRVSTVRLQALFAGIWRGEVVAYQRHGCGDGHRRGPASHERGAQSVPGRRTRRVQLVRGEGRDVSSQYRKGGGGGGLHGPAAGC